MVNALRNGIHLNFFRAGVALDVIKYLDNSSIVSLLNSIPQLKLDAILLTDHARPPLHFNLDGVTRRYINASSITQQETVHSAESNIFSPLRDRQQIRLIEVSLPCSDVGLVCDPAWVAVPRFRSPNDIPVNNTSFLYIAHNGCEGDSQDCLELVRRVDELPVDVKMVVGTPTFFENSRLSVDGSSYLYMHSLVTLRVETQSICRDITLPCLVQLCVVFTSLESQIPVLENITAPLLSQLTVHYNGLPPFMKGIDVAGDVPSNDGLRDGTVFELAHIPSLPVNRQSFSRPTQNLHMDLNLYEDADLSFTKNFLAHNYIGVPPELIGLADLSTVQDVRFHISEALIETVNAQLNLPECLKLEFYLTGPSAKIPALGSCPKVEALAVMVLDLGVDISSIWMTKFPELRHFTIYQSMSLMNMQNFNERSLFISPETWELFIKNSGPELHDFKLSGFKMPFLSMASWEPNLSEYHKLHVRPIIPKGTTMYLVCPQLSGMYHDRKRSSFWKYCELNIEPVFEDNNDRGKVELKILYFGHLQGRSFHLITSVEDWSGVVVNRHKLLTGRSETHTTGKDTVPIKHFWKIPVLVSVVNQDPLDLRKISTRVQIARCLYKYEPIYR